MDNKSSVKNLCIPSTTVLWVCRGAKASLSGSGQFECSGFILIGVIHGVAEVVERSTSIIVLINYIYHQLYERKRLPWGSFRTSRRERLATDIAIMRMLYEANAVISVNGFLHLHEYFCTVDKTLLQLAQ